MDSKRKKFIVKILILIVVIALTVRTVLFVFQLLSDLDRKTVDLEACSNSQNSTASNNF